MGSIFLLPLRVKISSTDSKQVLRKQYEPAVGKTHESASTRMHCNKLADHDVQICSCSLVVELTCCYCACNVIVAKIHFLARSFITKRASTEGWTPLLVVKLYDSSSLCATHPTQFQRILICWHGSAFHRSIESYCISFLPSLDLQCA